MGWLINILTELGQDNIKHSSALPAHQMRGNEIKYHRRQTENNHLIIFMKNKIIVFFLSIIISFFVLSPTLAIKLKIGSQCNTNADCDSGDCEESTKPDGTGGTLSFCDCDEVDLSVTGFDESQDCADRYGGKKGDWTCKDGPPATWDLDYCLNNLVAKNTKFPVEPLADPSFLNYILDPTMVLSTITYEDIKPDTKITIPNLEFSEVLMLEKTDASGMQSTYVKIPYLGEYIASIYRYGIAVAGVLAMVIIVIAGFEWTISGGNPERIKSAQKRIAGSITGLTIALLTYTLLYTVNPNLIKNGDLQIKYIEKINIDEIMASHTPGDAGDWGKKPMEETVSWIKIPLTIINAMTFRPDTVYAQELLNNLSIKEIIRYYTKQYGPYNKLIGRQSGTKTSLKPEYLQIGSCLGWPTEDLYGDEARKAAIDFAFYLRDSGIVSYTLGGYGAPCAILPKNTTSISEAACKIADHGSFECSKSLRTELDAGKWIKPWEINYCLDCSGFIHTIFKCGAQKFTGGKTELLFSCAADQLLMYQPIPRSITKPGDIVGFRKDPTKGQQTGHVLICLNNGCTKVMDVHGPQASSRQYTNKGLDEEPEGFLDWLEQSDLEAIRATLKKEWRGLESLDSEIKNKIKNGGNKDGNLSFKRTYDETGILPPEILLPETVIADMQKQVNFHFEFRRIMNVDYKDTKDIPPPHCDDIIKYSLCDNVVKDLKKSGDCI